MTEHFANQASDFLATACGPTDTTITVKSTAKFPAPNFRVRIGAEIMMVTGAATGTTYPVTRGIEGTSAIAHPTNALVQQVLSAASLGAIRADDVAASGGTGGVSDDTAAVTLAFAATPSIRLSQPGTTSARYQLPVLPSPPSGTDFQPPFYVHGDGWSVTSVAGFANSLWISARGAKGSVVRYTGSTPGYWLSQPATGTSANATFGDTLFIGPGIAGVNGLAFETNGVLYAGLADSRNVGFANWDIALDLGQNINSNWFSAKFMGCNTAITDGPAGTCPCNPFFGVYIQQCQDGIVWQSCGSMAPFIGGVIEGQSRYAVWLKPPTNGTVWGGRFDSIWFEANIGADFHLDLMSGSGCTINMVNIDSCRAGTGIFKITYNGGGVIQGLRVAQTIAPNWFIMLDRFANCCTFEQSDLIGGVINYSPSTAFVGVQKALKGYYIDANHGVTFDGSNSVTAITTQQASTGSVTTFTGVLDNAAWPDGSRCLTGPFTAELSTTDVAAVSAQLTASADAPWIYAINWVSSGDLSVNRQLLHIHNTGSDTDTRGSIIVIPDSGTRYKIRALRTMGGVTKTVDSPFILNSASARVFVVAFCGGTIYMLDETGAIVASGDGSVSTMSGAIDKVYFNGKVGSGPVYTEGNFRLYHFRTDVPDVVPEPGQDNVVLAYAKQLANFWSKGQL